MKRLVLALILLLTTAPAIAADILPPALLRTPVQISEDSLRLGDLFDNAGLHAQQVVAAAPVPGRRLVLDTVWLYKVARAYGVPWQPTSRKERAIVERLGQTLPVETLKETMREALVARGMAAESDVIFSSRTPALVVPVTTDPHVTVEDLAYDESQGRFSGTIVAGEASNTQRLTLAGRVVMTVPVPVPSRPLKKGDIITASDLHWRNLPAETVRSQTLTDPRGMIGRMATRSLREGGALREDDLEEPVLITRNKAVTVILALPGMVLTVRGKALENGVREASIRVENMASRKTILATVVDENTVRVSLATIMAAAE
ncbi:MAG: flagella basal body P-ring formation protein FlgA [Rhodospirillaceae bacterium]|nr:MAG: flagella basal body P-ring formation protein FlgA [Rhodospirillaceae bacterium]